MQAFHDDPQIKETYVRRLQIHQKMDEIIQGTYWEDGKGCAVGCTIHSDNHFAYETELGIPVQLAYLQDRLFERMTNADAKLFPLQFLEAIPVGGDLSLVTARFLLWLLQDILSFANSRGKEVIKTVIALYERKVGGEEVAQEEWRSADAAAADAADAANAYAAYAAAANAAAYAAYANADAAAAAAAAAYAAANAADAAAYRREKQRYCKVMADKLIELLRAAPIFV